MAITDETKLQLKELYMADLIQRITGVIDNFPNKSSISSVILTGSLGRNEATFYYDEKTNKARLISDVELALVYRGGYKKDAKVLKEILIRAFDEEINPMTISLSRVKNMYNFNYTIVKPKYNSIFMYDLYNGSRTIWGKDLIQEKQEKKLAKYDKYEAKRIVANRIGELAYIKYVDKAEERQIKQWEGKLMLALGTAYCIVKGSYHSHYKKQMEFISSNQEKDNICTLLGENFVNDYVEAYNHLRLGYSTYEVPLERIKYYVERMNTQVFNTNNAYKKSKINSMSRKLKYLVSFIKTKPADISITNIERNIIDKLIAQFIHYENCDDMKKLSIAWKRIIY